MAGDEVQLEEVLFEFIPNGRFVKVIAVDPISRVEIAMVGDRAASIDNRTHRFSHFLTSTKISTYAIYCAPTASFQAIVVRFIWTASYACQWIDFNEASRQNSCPPWGPGAT